ncbi:transforming protein p68/c-ets-1 [Lingula anatina]|uniref:Transforming protein p68/c-ets-1 n=1 Tax=Lingula anatina TaxID=7574 RepID=A0A1S3JP31_LINAN|nr:transforming protein p68/c-ets-1 [Lingula anatina]|eukprot:XP_013411896.1 transforming protein p68/c-ets-1 [Lingula anatina]
MDLEFYGDYGGESNDCFYQDRKPNMSTKPKRISKTYDGELGKEIERLNSMLPPENDDCCVPGSFGTMQKVPSMSDLSDESLDMPTPQVPPLTPGTNQKMSQALLESFKTFEREQQRLRITKDPQQWSEINIYQWLQWAIREFNLEGVQVQNFANMVGSTLCDLPKDDFLALCPPFVGEILWEHLEIMQKEVEQQRAALGNVPENFSQSVFEDGFMNLAREPAQQQPQQQGQQPIQQQQQQQPSPAATTAPPPPPTSGSGFGGVYDKQKSMTTENICH